MTASADGASSPAGAGRHFYEGHIALLERGDVDTLMTRYHDDARLVGLEFVVDGKDALRTHMTNYLKGLGSLKVLSTDKFVETDDSIFFEATVATGSGVARVFDVFLLRDGRIARHFTGLISFTPRQ